MNFQKIRPVLEVSNYSKNSNDCMEFEVELTYNMKRVEVRRGLHFATLEADIGKQYFRKRTAQVWDEKRLPRVRPVLSPLLELSTVLGVLPAGPGLLAAVYSRVVACLLALLFAGCKLAEFLSRRELAAQSPGMAIILSFILALGLPDLACVLLHAAKLDHSYVLALRRFPVYPVLYPRYLTPLGVVILLANTVPMVVHFKMDLTTFLIANLVQATSYLVLMQFCFYLHLLKERMSAGPDPTALCDSVEAQYGLLREARDLNRRFAGQLLILVFRMMLNSVIDLYQMFVMLRFGNTIGFFIFLSMLLWELYVLGALTSSCQAIKKKVEKFNEELFKFIVTNPELCSEVKLQMYVKMKPRIVFTACNFFNIGYPMVTSVIAGALSYFVILMQFSTG